MIVAIASPLFYLTKEQFSENLIKSVLGFLVIVARFGVFEPSLLRGIGDYY